MLYQNSVAENYMYLNCSYSVKIKIAYFVRSIFLSGGIFNTESIIYRLTYKITAIIH